MAIILKILPLEVNICKSFTEVGMFARHLLTQATPSQCNQRSCFAISSAWIYSLPATGKMWMNNASVKALWRLRRNLKFLIFHIILQSFQNWIQLNEFLERESNSLSPFVTGPGINYKLYCCFLHCSGIQKYIWMMSSWRGFASTETALSLPWIIFNVSLCRDSDEESKGWIPQSAKLNRLLNWLFPCKLNIFGQKCLCKLHVSVSCGACHCFSITPPLPSPTKSGLPRPEQKGCTRKQMGGGETMEKVQDGRLNHTSLSAGIWLCRLAHPELRCRPGEPEMRWEQPSSALKLVLALPGV